MLVLLEKALDYVDGVQMEEVEFLVRCKSFDYYKKVQLEENGIEKPYPKDEAGDEKCPINSKTVRNNTVYCI